MKRAVDIVVALTGLVLLAPILLAIALLVLADSGWPALYSQIRIGWGGRPFRLYKFRTMVVGAERLEATVFLKGHASPLYTGAGRLLRRYSLDELPQLWNVLVGDQSLVGPRAMLPVTAGKLSLRQQRRHRVRPGITGWAQINGREAIPWSKRVELDNWYIDHWSLWLDLRILLRTLPLVAKATGVRFDAEPGEVDDLG
jgi:lipopolysaccharide/colanic/teichoic acid biosynthesis glycosyltransferase